MKRAYSTLLFLALLLSTNWGRAQSTSPSLLGSGGDYFSTGAGTLTWSFGETVVETCLQGGNILTQGFVQPIDPVRVSGRLTYCNTGSTAVSNVMIRLVTQAGVTVDSALTDSQGNYRLYKVPPGTYTFSVTVNKPWGGANAVDALKILLHFTQVTLLSGMYLAASDVDQTGYTNSLDALTVAKRFTGMISTFQLSDWLYTADTVTVGTARLYHDLKCICAGDVNGSYIP